jgi:hypothetical protein
MKTFLFTLRRLLYTLLFVEAVLVLLVWDVVSGEGRDP